MYTYEIEDNPPMSKILKDGIVIDYSGPWESTQSAETWASMYSNALNQGSVSPEEPS